MKVLIPERALKKHIAILGMNGSGKTSVGKSQIIEPALARGERVCNIDPTGVGWGLRLGSSTKKGFDIYIVGGDRADFPLNRRDAKAWGEIVATSSDSFVFDTSQMTVEDRSQWFTDFAETVLRKNRGPLNFVLDEAHLFAPQGGSKSGGVAPRMLHATNNLLSLGRSRGLRVTMISQRAAKLHKDSLTQAHTLIAMMMTSPQDRNAVRDWIADQTSDDSGVVATLPTLSPGEGWIWAPAERVLERVKFPLPKTYDSSSAPDLSEKDAPSLKAIDPAKISGMLADVAKSHAANDPATLRAEIDRLRKAAATADKGASIEQVEGVRDAARKRGYEEGFDYGYETAHRSFSIVIAKLLEKTKTIPNLMNDAVRELMNEIGPPSVKPKPTSAPKPGIAQRIPAALKSVRLDRRSPAVGEHMPSTQQKIADAIRWWNALGVASPSQAQVAFVAGYSHKSGTWSTYLGRLRAAGMIEGRGELLLTNAGAAVAREPSVAPTAQAVQDAVLEKIDGPLRKILAPLLRVYPDDMTQSDLASEAGYSSSSGTWSTHLGRLRKLDLIDGRGRLTAQGWMFP